MYKPLQEKLRLNVYASDQTAELHIQDARLHTIKDGVGQLSLSLPAGAYKVIARSGDADHEEIVLLEDEGATVRIPSLRYTTAVPLESARAFDPSQAEFSREISRQQPVPPLRLGRGSALYLYVRDIQPHDLKGRRFPRTHPMFGLTLHTPNGELIETLMGVAPQGWDTNEQPQAARTIEVFPGSYRLRLELPSGESLEQVLVACRGWTTQLFLNRKFYGTEPESCCADLTEGSIFYGHLGAEFDPKNEDTRLTDLARRGLADHRNVVPGDALLRMLYGKFSNPMLGILAGHLLLLEQSLDPLSRDEGPTSRRLLESVNGRLSQRYGEGITFATLITNLRHLFSDEAHPDVEALALTLEDERSYTFRLPPMLRQSWSLVVAATARQPELVPVDSPASRIATRVLTKDPWLLWQNPAEGGPEAVSQTLKPYREALSEFHKSEPADFPGIDVKNILERLIRNRALKDAPPKSLDLPKVDMPGGLDVPEGVILGSGPPMMSRGKPAAAGVSFEALSDKDRSELVRRLGIPASSIQALNNKP